jgi:hypothetical protein
MEEKRQMISNGDNGTTDIRAYPEEATQIGWLVWDRYRFAICKKPNLLFRLVLWAVGWRVELF